MRFIVHVQNFVYKRFCLVLDLKNLPVTGGGCLVLNIYIYLRTNQAFSNKLGLVNRIHGIPVFESALFSNKKICTLCQSVKQL